MPQDHIKSKGSYHNSRTEIPNIVFSLGLSPHEFVFYCVLKKTAGDNGECFKSQKTLSEEVGCSDRHIRDMKKSLALPRKELGGLALITVTSRISKHGDQDTDLIEIEDIWNVNFKDFYSKERSSAGVRNQDPEGAEPGSYKEDPFNKIPIKQQQYISHVAAAAVFSCLKDLKIPEPDKIWLSQNHNQETVEKALAWATHPSTKIKSTLEQAIKWACKNNPEVPINLEDEQEKNRQFAIDVANRANATKKVTIEVLSKHVEIITPGYNSTAMCISYNEKGFKEQLENFLRKKEIYLK